MGTIADKLTYLGQTKSEIRDAIISKGVSVPANTTFREYAGKIRGIGAGSEGEEPDEWKRPGDWLPIEGKVTAGEHKFVGLYAIFEEGNFISLSAAGNYTVDWGDGVVENFASGVQADHIYSYDSFPGTESADGYRQAIVTVTPQAGQNLTGINLQCQHRQSGLNIIYSTGWLDIRISGENIVNLSVGGSTSNHRYLQTFCFLGKNGITDFNRLFFGCYDLQFVPLFDTSKGKDFSYMFSLCSSLQSVPQLDTAGGTDFSYMFQGCSSLLSVPQLDTSNGTNFSYMFISCYKLKSIPLFNTSKGTSFRYMFSSCYAIKSGPLLDTSNGTNFSYMFSACYALESIPVYNTSKGAYFNYMFQGCIALKNIALSDTSKGVNFGNMFQGCTLLKTGPIMNTSNGTDFRNMFFNCSTLQSIPFYDTAKGTNFNYTFGSCPALKTIPLLNTSSGTTFIGMFSFCSILRTIPLLDTSKGTDFSTMFTACYSLEMLPSLNVSNGTVLSSMLTNCGSMSKAPFSGTKNTISYEGCKLSRAALVEVFNKLASGVTTKTITINNNWGAPLLTTQERAIATDKGWTIIG